MGGRHVSSVHGVSARPPTHVALQHRCRCRQHAAAAPAVASAAQVGRAQHCTALQSTAPRTWLLITSHSPSEAITSTSSEGCRATTVTCEWGAEGGAAVSSGWGALVLAATALLADCIRPCGTPSPAAS